MNKKVISFRLSEGELRALDRACVRLGMTRTEAISAGISVLLSEYLKEGERLVRRAPWLVTSLEDGRNGSKP